MDLEKVHAAKNAEKLSSETLSALTLEEEEELLTHLVDDYHGSYSPKLEDRIKTVHAHFMNRKKAENP